MWRNKEEHDNTYVRPDAPVHHILTRRHDNENAKNLTKKVSGDGVGNKNMGWKPPLNNMVKLNTDGANKYNILARCEGVIREDKGMWISGFSKFVRHCNALTADCWVY